jgi:hypothetical protein
MKKMRLLAALAILCIGLSPKGAHAQAFDAAGTRAAGMGGAFVAVADDATAIYWNPAGLAAGSFFSLVLDAGTRKATPEESLRGVKQSSYFLGLTTPALGLGYYRLSTASAVPDALLVPIELGESSRNLTGAPFVRVERLVTHHAGITLVQSIVPSVAVGTTLKWVRGFASSEIRDAAEASAALDVEMGEARGASKFDLDFGVMASAGGLKGGLSVRNLRQPEFTTPEGRTIRLERQARAGVSYVLLPAWMIAADVDLVSYADAFGLRRDAAVGLEGRITSRASVRTGARWNTAGTSSEDPRVERRALTFGASYAVKAAVFVDATAVIGGDAAGRGWGVAARFIY